MKHMLTYPINRVTAIIRELFVSGWLVSNTVAAASKISGLISAIAEGNSIPFTEEKVLNSDFLFFSLAFYLLKLFAPHTCRMTPDFFCQSNSSKTIVEFSWPLSSTAFSSEVKRTTLPFQVWFNRKRLNYWILRLAL